MVSVRSLVLSIFIPEFLADNNSSRKQDDKNEYGDGYGTRWVFVPDGDGNPYFVNMQEQISGRSLMEPEYNVKFRLHTRRNLIDYVLLDEHANLVNNTDDPFIRGAPVKVLVHGWMSSADRNFPYLTKNEYLKAYDCNVICVDWSDIADFLMYPSVAMQARAIANIIGMFLDSLSDRYGVTGDQLHLVGHSMGAHISGTAATVSKLRIGRISGLDAARPMFEFPPVSNDYRLDKSDAVFVDLIHTSSATVGMEGAVGHADFYPNNGYAPQPGCGGVRAYFEACSHSRAHFYFTETINHPKAFPAVRCKSWNDFGARKCDNQTVYMGEHLPRDATGVFYLTTNSAQPFGRSI